jgi:hypothetical protein
LTTDQLDQILGTAPQGEPDSTAGFGPSCNWHADATVSVSYITQAHQGLSAVYQNTKPKVTLWPVLPLIQGFPAVGFADKLGERAGDICTVSVGIADDLSFNAGLVLSPAKTGKADPCDLARVADMVVTNLRQKAGESRASSPAIPEADGRSTSTPVTART